MQNALSKSEIKFLLSLNGSDLDIMLEMLLDKERALAADTDGALEIVNIFSAELPAEALQHFFHSPNPVDG